ncbi:IS1380 family transposase [Citricoccus muralis]|uniref:DDE family transposase n=1 Tax=Citricoccus muralis TaxID=169134 RepID=A0A3D9L871_9MICC|nr:IS1380 family transposase [Citricoccus muralis]REE02282.1 DDE family transposase [Citricoccus muralis]
MQVSHTPAAVSASFDDPNLLSAAGLVPIMRLAQNAGLSELAQQWLSVPTDKGANAGSKVSSLVAGMVAGADSIDDMAVLRHGAMAKLFHRIYAPSTLGSFLRAFTFGHVRQLDAVASRLLQSLSRQTSLLVSGEDQYTFLDVDDTIIEVHGHAKQGSGYGYSGVRGLNALLATASTPDSAPVILAQRLRRGAVGSPRGAQRLVRDSLATLRRLHQIDGARVLVRADSAFYGHATVTAAISAGADVSVTARMDPVVKKAIAGIDDHAWTPIEYPEAIYDEATDRWISNAEVAEVPFTAFTSRKKNERVPGRLVVRRIPELNQDNKNVAQPGLFDLHRFHTFFTTSTLDTVVADKTHRAHAVIEQVNADLKNSALARLPSGVFTANAAWLVLAAMAFNLTRGAATITGPGLAKATTATTATIRRKIINIPARIASSARRIILHLPRNWPWQDQWQALFEHGHGPPAMAVT